MIMVFILVSLVALFIMSMVMNRYTSMSTSEISYLTFSDGTKIGKVESVEFDSTRSISHRFKKTESISKGTRLIIVVRLDDPDLLLMKIRDHDRPCTTTRTNVLPTSRYF